MPAPKLIGLRIAGLDDSVLEHVGYVMHILNDENEACNSITCYGDVLDVMDRLEQEYEIPGANVMDSYEWVAHVAAPMYPL